MTTQTLEDIIRTFNQRFSSVERRYPCFSGAIKAKQCDCSDLSRHVLPPLPPQGSSPSWVVSRIDDWSQGQTPDDHDVIIAVGINYGQNANIPVLYDRTNMRVHLNQAFNLLQTNLKPGCIANGFSVPQNFHLVAFNFFPWLTSAPWSELGLNGIEEALLIYCLGYPDVFEPLKNLLSSIQAGGGRTIWIVFHGANNAIPMLGTAFCQTLDPIDRPDILFCDNLAWRVTSNSVVLCRPNGRAVIDQLPVDK